MPDAAPRGDSLYIITESLTYNIYQSEKLAEEVSVRPEVVVLEVGVDVVQDQLLLQPLLALGDDAEVQVHGQGPHLIGQKKLITFDTRYR